MAGTTGEKEWLDQRFKDELEATKGKGDDGDDSDSDSLFSVDSNDTLHNFIDFQSHRNSTGLEEAVSFTYPFGNTAKETEPNSNNDGDGGTYATKSITLSTLLEEDDLVPIFDGAGWAGTRVWSAA